MHMLGGLALVALTAACSPKIGDACTVSTDCSIRGERSCDLSYRVLGNGIENPNGKGECIIEGCARGNCLKEADCVKIYSTEFFSVACDPEREDVATQCVENPEGEPCPADCLDEASGEAKSCPPLDACDNNEICLPEGVCATEVGARTSCRFECKNNGDCRTGYRCAATGHDGIYAAPSVSKPLGFKETKICVPDT